MGGEEGEAERRGTSGHARASQEENVFLSFVCTIHVSTHQRATYLVHQQQGKPLTWRTSSKPHMRYSWHGDGIAVLLAARGGLARAPGSSLVAKGRGDPNAADGSSQGGGLGQAARWRQLSSVVKCC
eukprot:1160282-Pelagomonas_calceolata.AAC.2